MNIRQTIQDIREHLQQARSLSDVAMRTPVHEFLGREDHRAVSNLLSDLESSRSLLETALYALSTSIDTQLKVNEVIGKRYYLAYAHGSEVTFSLKALGNVSDIEGPWGAGEGGLDQAKAMVRFRRAQRTNVKVLLVEFDPKDGTFVTIDVPEEKSP